MKHLKIASVLLSAAICMSFVMTPVMVTADETEVPEQTTEATEAPETKETEATKETEKAKEPEVTEPSESVSETTETEPSVQNKENEETEPSESAPETTETEPSEESVLEESRETEPSESSEPSESETEAEPTEPETASRKSVNAEAGGGFCGQNAKWQYDGNGNFKVTGSGDMQNYSVSTVWDKYLEDIKTVVISDGITSIGSESFDGGKNITSVTIADSVTKINDFAFAGCTSLTKITLPSNLKTLGFYAFAGCKSLKSIVIPGTVTNLSGKAFSDCGITSVTIRSGVKTIDDAFENCKSLTTVSIPKSVTSIKDAFNGCTGIKEINYSGTAEDWSKINFGGTNPFKNAVIRYNATYYSLTVKDSEYGSITLSKYSAVEGETITVIAKPNEGYYLFAVKVDNVLWRGNSFTMGNKDVVISPDFRTIYQSPVGDIKRDSDGMRYKITNNAINGTGTVECIGFYIDPGIDESVLAKAFAVANIPAAVVLDGVVYKVTVIGSNAFRDNKYVKTVSIGSNVAVIGNNAFFGCVNLTKVSGGARVKTIGANAFARCPKLSSFTITSKVLNKIGTYAFAKDSKLKTISIKNTTKLSKKGVKKSLKSSKIKTVKVKKSKVGKYRKYFTKKNCGRKVKVKK